MGYSKFPIIKAEIDYINHLIEYERSLAGQDDELEDEFVLWIYINQYIIL